MTIEHVGDPVQQPPACGGGPILDLALGLILAVIVMGLLLLTL